MKHKTFMPAQEREARSKIAKTLSWKVFIRGGLVRMERTCGKPNCKCMRGDKHVSLYLSCRYKGKRKMVYIPEDMEKAIIAGVKSYKECKRLIDIISDSCIKRLIKREVG